MREPRIREPEPPDERKRALALRKLNRAQRADREAKDRSFADFLAHACVRGEALTIGARALHFAYQRWAARCSRPAMTPQAFGRRARAALASSANRKRAGKYFGVAVIPEAVPAREAEVSAARAS